MPTTTAEQARAHLAQMVKWQKVFETSCPFDWVRLNAPELFSLEFDLNLDLMLDDEVVSYFDEIFEDGSFFLQEYSELFERQKLEQSFERATSTLQNLEKTFSDFDPAFRATFSWAFKHYQAVRDTLKSDHGFTPETTLDLLQLHQDFKQAKKARSFKRNVGRLLVTKELGAKWAERESFSPELKASIEDALSDEILFEAASPLAGDSKFADLAVTDDGLLVRVPRIALGEYTLTPGSFVELKGVNEASIETMIVLFRDGGYASLTEALATALALEVK